MNISSPGTVVLKFGSRLLTNGTSELDTDRMASVARAVADHADQNIVIMLVGSGETCRVVDLCSACNS